MPRVTPWLILLALALTPSLAFTPPLAADETVRAGGEFQVNTHTTNDQGYPDIAVDAQGNVLVVWESYGGQDGQQTGIFSQLLSSGGVPLAAETQVNTYTTDVQWDPAVAADGQGNFVVVWRSYGQDGAEFGIFGQRFDSSGSALGAEFQANTFTARSQIYPAVAADADGNFLVVWESRAQDLSHGGIFAQFYDSAGAEVGGEFQVNDTTAGEQREVRVATLADGFIVTWRSDLVDGSDSGIILQRLDTNADPVGGEQVVNTFTTGVQESPAIAVASDDSFAVVWESEVGQDGSGDSVHGQVFDSSGVKVGGEFQLNTYTTDDQENPRVAADGVGGFVAVWESKAQVDGSPGEDIFGQRFDTSGQFVEGEFQVNSQSSYDQDLPEIAGGVDGRFMVVWQSTGDFDGSGLTVFAQRFENALFADGFESGDTLAWALVTP